MEDHGRNFFLQQANHYFPQKYTMMLYITSYDTENYVLIAIVNA